LNLWPLLLFKPSWDAHQVFVSILNIIMS
jgi:hypothetical protein